MSYLFGGDGRYVAKYDDKSDLVYVLEGLRLTLKPEVVQQATANRSPAMIGGFKVLLAIHEPHLRDIAATVHSEVGVAHDQSEAEGIARVIRNRAEYKKVSLDSARLFGNVGGSSMYGRTTANYRTAKGLPIERWTGNLKSDLEGTVRGLAGTADVTNGAYFWDATRDVLKPTHQWVRNQWIGGKDPHYQGASIEGDYTPLWIWKADLGETSFFAYNPSGKQPKNVWP